MKFRPAIILLLLPLLFGYSYLGIPGKLRKGFEALEIYNYFKAKELFEASLKRDSVPSAYGLSIIYSRYDNPFTDLDSALKYISISERRYSQLDDKEREDYQTLGVDSSSIFEHAFFIDSLGFERAVQANDLAQYNKFIDHFQSPYFLEEAIENRNELAFKQALTKNTSAAYLQYLDTYPNSKRAAEAEKLFQKSVFLEETNEGEIQSYIDFIQNYPESPYAGEAEFAVFQLATKDGKAASFVEFARKYPQSPFADEAWRKVYALKVTELSPKNIAAFTLEFPDYPFMNELKQDFNLAATRYYPVEIEGQWGFIDEDGNLRVEARFEWAESFSEGFAVVGIDEKVTFVDKTDRLITEFIFDEAYSMKNGYAVVEKDGKMGLINRLGFWVVQPVFDEVGEFSDGYFYAGDGDTYGYLNEKGEIAIPFDFDDATDFKNGLAIVEQDGKYGLINQEGRIITPFQYDWIEPFHSDRRPARVKINGKFGLIDQAGTILVDTVYDALSDFNEGLALAASNGVYGFINLRGDTAIDFSYTFSNQALSESRFINGFAKVFQKDKLGVIDTSGAKVFPAIFEDIGIFKGKLIPVKKKGKWGYANRKVDLAIPYSFESALGFRDSLAIVQTADGFGLIDTTGKFFMSPKFSHLEFLDTLLLVSDTAYGILSLNGDTLAPLIFEEAEVVDEHVVQFRDFDDKLHYYDYRRMKFIWREPEW